MIRGGRKGDLTVSSARVGAMVVCVMLPEYSVQQELMVCGCRPLERLKRYVVKANKDACPPTFGISGSLASIKLEGCDQVEFPHSLFDLVR